MHPDYRIVRAHEDEVPRMIQWAKELGWNPGLNDANCFYQVDPNGFFLGKLHDEIIAMGAGVIYDEHFGFCGLYIVAPDYRHQGYGMALTKARLAYLGNRSIGLDGVLDMVAEYKHIGYKIAHHNFRYRLDVDTFDKPSCSKVVDARTLAIEEVASYDAKHFPARRQRFLEAWIHQPGAKSALFLEHGHIAGFAVMRPCVVGYKIGPLFAQSPEIAEALFMELLSNVKHQPVYLDIPACNPHALALVTKFKMSQEFETVRMYRQQKPLMNMHHIYGITTYELG